MTSPPPPAPWLDRYPVAGFDHQKFMGKYRYCSQCLSLNPNPPLEPTVRHSSIAPSSSQRPASEALGYASRSYQPNPRSSSLSQTRSPTTTMPPPTNPALRFGAVAQRAETERQKGFRNNQPPPRNAGSNAISFRKAPSASTLGRAEKEKRVSVRVQSYCSEVIQPDKDDALGGLPKRKSVQRFGEPVMNYWNELDWDAREWEQPFEEWVFEQCRIKPLHEIKESPGFLNFIPCAAVDIGKLVITRVGAAMDRKESLQDKLDSFAIPPKKGVREVNIVIEYDWRIREQLRNPNYDPDESDRQSTRQSTRTTTPFTVSEYEHLRHQLPDLQSLGPGASHPRRSPSAGYGLPATVRQSVEGTQIKQEKASWLSVMIDPEKPPDHIDLTTPLRNTLSRNESMSLPSSPVKPPRKTQPPRDSTPPLEPASDDDRINSPPIRRRKGKAATSTKKAEATSRKEGKAPKAQSKRQKRTEIVPDSTDHSYGTRYAEARQKKKAGSS